MFINTDDMNNVKIEISLKDLIDLQESAKMYFFVVEERDRYSKELTELRKKVENFENKGCLKDDQK